MAERVKYENKAVKITKTSKVTTLEVMVIKPHDGLCKGTKFIKPYNVAKMMIAKGYWKEVKKSEK